MVEEKIAAWLHAVELEPGSERQEAIEAAAMAYAGSAKSRSLPDLVLLAHGIGAEGAFSQVTEAVTAHDGTFGCGIEELETHLIAAVLVAEVLARRSLAASTAAALVRNAAAIGLTSPVADLPHLARDASHRRGGQIRGRGPVELVLDVTGLRDGAPAFEQDGAPAMQEDVRALRDASADALAVVVKGLETLTGQLSGRLNAADEELDLLWWCFSERSDTLKKRWSQVDDGGLAAIAAAVEMHSLVRFPAEPQSSRALLAKVLGSHSDTIVTLASAVASASGAQISVDIATGHQLLPVLTSLNDCNELSGDVAWQGSVGRWHIEPDRSWTALDLADECLRELIVNDRLV